MPSKNKTAYLGLNQWQGNEYPKRQDFVEDNEKIDEIVKGLAEGTVLNENLETDNKAYVGAINEVNRKVVSHQAEIATLQTEKANKTQENWISPTLQNGWAIAYSPGYRINNFGNLEIKGTARDGTTTVDTVIFTLPVGYRPRNQIRISCVTYTAISASVQTIAITPDGEVKVAYTDSSRYISFDGISIPLK